MFTIRPEPCAFSIGTNARVPRTTPNRLMSKIHCQSSSEHRSIRPPPGDAGIVDEEVEPTPLGGHPLDGGGPVVVGA